MAASTEVAMYRTAVLAVPMNASKDTHRAPSNRRERGALMRGIITISVSIMCVSFNNAFGKNELELEQKLFSPKYNVSINVPSSWIDLGSELSEFDSTISVPPFGDLIAKAAIAAHSDDKLAGCIVNISEDSVFGAATNESNLVKILNNKNRLESELSKLYTNLSIFYLDRDLLGEYDSFHYAITGTHNNSDIGISAYLAFNNSSAYLFFCFSEEHTFLVNRELFWSISRTFKFH